MATHNIYLILEYGTHRILAAYTFERDAEKARHTTWSGSETYLKPVVLVPASDEPATCPCELCGTPTSYLHTKRCDRCHELETRMRKDARLALKVLGRMIEK